MSLQNKKKKHLSFDYKDPLNLYNYLDGGKIHPARVNDITHSQQLALTKAVKKARSLGLLPSSYTDFDNFGRPQPISPQPLKI